MKEKMSTIYKIIILIVSGIGLYLNFRIVGFKSSIVYFTIISNIFCFIFYFLYVFFKAINKLNKNNTFYLIKGMMTMSLVFTMIVFNIFMFNSDEIKNISNSLIETGFVHILVPTLVIYDYIFFDEKGKTKIRYAFEWSFVLIMYLLIWYIYTSLGGLFINNTIYPYYYMNIDKLGLKVVIVNNLLLYLSFIFLGIIVVLIDKVVVNDKNNSKNKEVFYGRHKRKS